MGRGGFDTSAPDGIGDLCQNGDFNGDGEVDMLDITLQRRGLIGLEPMRDPALPPCAPQGASGAIGRPGPTQLCCQARLQ